LAMMLLFARRRWRPKLRARRARIVGQDSG
jgi:hypothetical protein